MAFDLDDEELEATRRLPCNQQKYNSVEFRVKNLQRLINCGYLELNRNEVETIEYLVQRHEKLKKVETKLEEKNISVETLLAEFERLENIEFELDKEKEKREIAEENHKTLSLDLGQALKNLGLPEDTIIADELVLEINKKYVSRDKIKQFIEENTKYISFGEQDTYLQGQRDENDELMDKLEELLKGE